MPTYDYECDACSHKFEAFQGISEDVLKKCPKCKKAKLRRLFGAGAGLIFKGSGFYATDNRSKPKTSSSSSPTPPSSPSSSSAPSESSSGDSSGGGSSSEPKKPAAKERSA